MGAETLFKVLSSHMDIMQRCKPTLSSPHIPGRHGLQIQPNHQAAHKQPALESFRSGSADPAIRYSVLRGVFQQSCLAALSDAGSLPRPGSTGSVVTHPQLQEDASQISRSVQDGRKPCLCRKYTQSQTDLRQYSCWANALFPHTDTKVLPIPRPVSSPFGPSNRPWAGEPTLGQRNSVDSANACHEG
jgi:hypothetical protein